MALFQRRRKHNLQVLHCESEQGAAEAPSRETERLLRVSRLLQEGKYTGIKRKYSPPKICLVSIPCDGHGTFVPQYPQGSRLMLCVLHFAGRGWHSKAKYLAVAYLPRALRKYLKLGRTRCISSCPNEAKEPYDVLLRIRLKAGVREGMIIFGCSGSSTQVVAMRDARLPDKT